MFHQLYGFITSSFKSLSALGLLFLFIILFPLSSPSSLYHSFFHFFLSHFSYIFLMVLQCGLIDAFPSQLFNLRYNLYLKNKVFQTDLQMANLLVWNILLQAFLSLIKTILCNHISITIQIKKELVATN